jgi:glycosyltransferase involved in cell wall biosynthesis
MSVKNSNRLISVIIPTLNEQSGIGNTIEAIPRSLLLSEFGYDLELIVIDGHSTDSTREIAKKMGAEVILEKRIGYGRALRTGFAAAKGEIIVTTDADNTYPIGSLTQYVKELKKGDYDFISINRFSLMEKGAMSLTKRIGNKFLTKLANRIYSIDLKDSQSGMWIMKRSFISDIRLRSDGMSLSQEIKIIAFKSFNSKELDGLYQSRNGEPKLRVVKDGCENLRHLFDFKKEIDTSFMNRPISSFDNGIRNELINKAIDPLGEPTD